MMKHSAWFIRLAGEDSHGARLFAFPYSGGSAGSYAHWKSWWNQPTELWGVQPPGRAARMAEQPIADIAEFVAQLVPEMLPLLDKPYVLFGHSNGALTAVAVANRLLQLGARRPEGIILSGKRSPSLGGVRERVSALPDDDFLARLRSLNGTPKELLDNPEIMRLFFPAIRADFAIGETYALENIHPALSEIPALILAGTDDPAGISEVFAWKDIFAGARTALLTGDHFFINTDPAFATVVGGFCASVLDLHRAPAYAR